jgi:mono/diheme cytochrome c family protein
MNRDKQGVMRMRTVLLGVGMFVAITAITQTGVISAGQAGTQASITAAAALAGDPAAGKLHYTFGNTSCTNCHGVEGKGAFGPALAGRPELTYERFRNYVRNPAGRMPAYNDDHGVTDQEIADMVAYFQTLPKSDKPLPWRTPLPEGAPRGQQLAVAVIGCAQCHGATFTTPRHGAAEVTGDFEWFKRQVYDHTTTMREHWALLDRSLQPLTPAPSGPPGRNRIRMGNYSPARLPEATLKEMWDWMNDIGLYLSVIRGRITPVEPGPSARTYTVDVINTAVRNRGITNEDITVTVAIPDGVTVVNATGAGYQGVRYSEESKSDVAAWRIPILAPGDRQAFTLTLSAPASTLRGIVTWAKPAVKADGEIEFALAAPGGRGGRGGV